MTSISRPCPTASRPRILFRAAAGPRIGSGHLVRALRLSLLAGSPAVLSIRGRRADALRLTLPFCDAVDDGPAESTFEMVRPDLLVIDDPRARAAQSWSSAARRRRCPIVSLVDSGIGCHRADIVVDGSAAGSRFRPPTLTLDGPAFAVVDPAVSGRSLRASRTVDRPPTVFIALGGGYRTRYAARLARDLRALDPRVHVTVAGGFVQPSREAPTAERVQWLGPQRTLVPWLRDATVAVVAGGITLYEACAVGTATVALPLVPLQRPAIRALTRLGAVRSVPGAAAVPPQPERVAREVCEVLQDRALRQALRTRARAVVDGRGAHRVADILRRLARGVAPEAVVEHALRGAVRKTR